MKQKLTVAAVAALVIGTALGVGPKVVQAVKNRKTAGTNTDDTKEA